MRNKPSQEPQEPCPEPFARPELCAVCRLSPVVEGLKRCSRLVTESPAMRALLQRAARVAAADGSVVLLGESGTGKEVLARALHVNSARRGRRFLAVNVAALPPELLESELFGHRKGAFTGAVADKPGLLKAADGGTLFLDEIAEMPIALQVKLLRALQDGEVRRVGDTRTFAVDVRVMCATHRDLAGHVARGLFREDLYYRLKVFTLTVPPLRARREDILPLARMFLGEEGAGLRIGAAARRLLERYAWPGNVRELAAAMKHGAAFASGGTLEPGDLPDELTAPPRPPREARGETLAEVERAHVLAVLEARGGSQTEAARVLGIGRSTLWRKLRGYGISG